MPQANIDPGGNMMEPFEYLAAKLSLGKLDAFEIQKVVDELLNEGRYDDEFINIIDSMPPRMDEVMPSFLRLLDRLGVKVPAIDKAVWLLIDHYTARIADGIIDPIEGLKRLIADIYWDYDFHSRTREFLGDSHGIENLIGLYWGYDDMMDGVGEMFYNGKTGFEGLKELKQEIVSEARRWREANSGKRE